MYIAMFHIKIAICKEQSNSHNRIDLINYLLTKAILIYIFEFHSFSQISSIKSTSHLQNLDVNVSNFCYKIIENCCLQKDVILITEKKTLFIVLLLT